MDFCFRISFLPYRYLCHLTLFSVVSVINTTLLSRLGKCDVMFQLLLRSLFVLCRFCPSLFYFQQVLIPSCLLPLFLTLFLLSLLLFFCYLTSIIFRRWELVRNLPHDFGLLVGRRDGGFGKNFKESSMSQGSSRTFHVGAPGMNQVIQYNLGSTSSSLF